MPEPTPTPGWLASALEEDGRPASSPELPEEAPADLLPGDLCVVTPHASAPALGRLFLVTDSEPGRCVGMLASAETELASEVDAILQPADTGLPYPIAAHTRFSGPVWVTQVRRRIGAVPAGILDQLLALGWSDEPGEMTVTRGMALQPDGVEPRFRALRALSAEMDALTEHCRRGVDPGVVVIDPVLAELDVLPLVLAAPGWHDRIGDATASAAFQDRLVGSYPLLSRDEQQAARQLLERAVDARPRAGREGTPAIPGHRDPAALGQALSTSARVPAVVTVLSHRRCWHTPPSTTTRVRVGAEETMLVVVPIADSDRMEAA